MNKFNLLKWILAEILTLEQLPPTDFSKLGQGKEPDEKIDPNFFKGFVPGQAGDDDYKTNVGGKMAPQAAQGNKTIPQMNMNTMQAPAAVNAKLDNRSQQVQVFPFGPNNFRVALGQKKSGKVVLDFSNPNKIVVSDQ